MAQESITPGGQTPPGGHPGGHPGWHPGHPGRPDLRRVRDLGLAVVAWVAVLGIFFWTLGHIIGSLVLFLVAAILAYALAPAVGHLQRFMPRGIAIAIVYLGILTTLSGLMYLIVITAAGQVSLLLKDVQALLTPGPHGEESPLVATFKAIGLTDTQIQDTAQRMLAQVQGVTGDPVTLAAGVVDALVRTVLVGVLSIYLLRDGPRIVRWLRTNTPIAQRPRIVYFVDTLDTVVGGYIRGQLTLSALIGILVGGGMWLFSVPYAVFLGVLAFILEFIPIVGVFISGAICVMLALTQGVGVAVVVLIYFVGVHFIEGDIVGPRVMSEAVGLHPALSILALFAGSELFGIWGALFAAPVAGLTQAVIRSIWLEWRESHPEQFPTGYTVAPDVRIVPVTHAEPPPPTTVEPGVTAEPAEPMYAGSTRGDAAPHVGPASPGDGASAPLLPEVAAWTPANGDPPTGSIYDRFRVLEPELDDRAGLDGRADGAQEAEEPAGAAPAPGEETGSPTTSIPAAPAAPEAPGEHQ